MKYTTTLIFIFILLSSISFVSAAGVSSFYSESRPLEMHLGETKTINFNLQNMVGDKDVTFKIEIIQGTEIAGLEKDIYLVKTRTHDTMVPLTITIPEDYSKTTTKIELEFKTITSIEGGGIGMGTGYKTPFNVIISEKPEEEKPISKGTLIVSIIMVIVIVIVIIIVIYILKKRKTSKS